MIEYTRKMFEGQFVNQKVHEDFPYRYFLDEDGNIYRQMKSGEIKKIKVTIGRRYPKVTIFGRHIRVHQIVARVFLGKCPFGKEIDHIDGNRFNYHPSNLRYVTHQENVDAYYFRTYGKYSNGREI